MTVRDYLEQSREQASDSSQENARQGPGNTAVGGAQSRTLGEEKLITLHTPILIGNSHDASGIQAQHIKYRKGERLHDNTTIPDVCATLPYGLVLDLLLIDTEAYVRKYLSWMPRRSDENLVENLTSFMSRSQKPEQTSKRRGITEKDLLGSPWFISQSNETKQSIVDGIDRLKETSHLPIYTVPEGASLLDTLLTRRNKL